MTESTLCDLCGGEKKLNETVCQKCESELFIASSLEERKKTSKAFSSLFERKKIDVENICSQCAFVNSKEGKFCTNCGFSEEEPL